MSEFTPLRSVLYMPSSNERALEKAKTIACDALILDLEDAVAPDAKPAAREAAAAAAASGDYGRRTVTIRVNGIGTEWHEADLTAASQAGPAAIVVPKVDSAEQVVRLVDMMEKAGAPDHTALWAMVETPEAIFNVREIAAASPRLQALVLGTNDLVKELYAEHVPGRAPILPSLHTVLLAGRAAGIAVIDGVYNDVKDTDGFLAECEQGRQMGFDGKTLIHPGQVEGANTAFAPSEQAVEDARGLIAAFEDGQGIGRGDLQRPDGREPARRVRPAHALDPRRDPGSPDRSRDVTPKGGPGFPKRRPRGRVLGPPTTGASQGGKRHGCPRTDPAPHRNPRRPAGPHLHRTGADRRRPDSQLRPHRRQQPSGLLTADDDTPPGPRTPRVSEALMHFSWSAP